MLTKAKPAEDVVEIVENQEATDMQKFTSSLTTETGESAKLPAFVKVAAVSFASSILFLAPTNALSTDHVERTPAITNQQTEGYTLDGSTAHKLASIRERYEKTLFSYPGLIVDVQRTASGDPISATILVSVDGNDHAIQRPIKQIGFEVEPNMRVIADGIERGGIKKIAFRIPAPVELDEEELDIIRDL